MGGDAAVSADNYAVVAKRREGVWCVLMGFASDDDELFVVSEHPTQEEAEREAHNGHYEYGLEDVIGYWPSLQVNG